MRSPVKFLLLICLVLLLSCSSEKTTEVSKQSQDAGGTGNVSGTAPAQDASSGSSGPYSVEITPATANCGSVLRLTPRGFNLSDGKVEWLVNGSGVESPSADQFSAAATKKGDQVQARATVRGSVALSNIVQITNAPPQISQIRFIPPVTTSNGAILGVEVAGKDCDGDPVTFTYEWRNNGAFAGNESKIEVPVHRGDRFSVKVIPFDGETNGQPAVIDREIGNLPPKLTEVRRTGFDGKTITYQASAIDADGDTLTYSLKSAPSGMTIDPSSGAIRWTVPEGFRGKASFVVTVSDGHGGESTREQGVEIKATTK